jgi:glucose-1-phosphate cytidylyltransferase
MKVVILAGGLGSRLSEETVAKPKPMVEIGGRPILWHIMKIYAAHGANDFIICLGYKGYVIKEFFANYFLHNSDVTFDLANNSMQTHNSLSDAWKVTLVDTGQTTMTGGRLKRIAPYIRNEEYFGFTYGDGLSDVDITKTVELHKKEGRLATLLAAQPQGRFGALRIEGSKVTDFHEKPRGDQRSVNAGFFVLSPKVLDYIQDDQTSWEREPLERLANEGQLSAFVHEGFWQPMDTVFDRNYLEGLWEKNQAPWKVW